MIRPIQTRNSPNHVYWGVAHVHTGYSFDSGAGPGYYVRVIQIPSPRWTAYDQKRYGIKMPDYVPMTVTDRVYS